METKSSKRHVYADVSHAPVTSVLADGDVPYVDHDMDADEQVIVALGYKQEFKREFSLWTTFCVSFAVLGLLPSFASTLYYGEFSLQPTCCITLPLIGFKEWAMQEPRAWCGDGSLLWCLSSVLQCQWLSSVQPCPRGKMLFLKCIRFVDPD